MTSFHNHVALEAWVESVDASDATQWPKLTAEVVNGNTRSSRFLREEILDMLARCDTCSPPPCGQTCCVVPTIYINSFFICFNLFLQFFHFKFTSTLNASI